METWIMDLGLLITGMLVHEATHYVVYRWQGIPSKISLMWYGMETRSDFSETIKELNMNLLAAIFAGMIPVVFVHDNLLFFAYFVACLFDTSLLITSIELIRKKVITGDERRNEFRIMLGDRLLQTNY